MRAAGAQDKQGVPGIIALLLIAGSFILGHWTQTLHQEATAGDGTAAAPQIEVQSRHLRRLAVQKQQNTQVQKLALPDPLDTAALERFMLESSGILKVRPPIPAGRSGEDFLRVIPFQILSWAPRLVVFPAFIDKARCEAIMRIANKTMYKSTVAFRPGEKNDPKQQIRTSSGTYLTSGMEDDSAPLAWLEERIAAATLLPSSHGEAFNVLHYENDQHYDSHMDTFDPKEYGPQASQRVATILVYLEAPEEGGETVFKREGADGEKRQITEWRNCDDGVGFKYQPRQGDAVLFWATHPDGSIDPHALHGGCPVKKGNKWVATKWVHTKKVYLDRAAEIETEKKKVQQQQENQA